jgi:hypothetical protein
VHHATRERIRDDESPVRPQRDRGDASERAGDRVDPSTWLHAADATVGGRDDDSATRCEHVDRSIERGGFGRPAIPAGPRLAGARNSDERSVGTKQTDGVVAGVRDEHALGCRRNGHRAPQA